MDKGVLGQRSVADGKAASMDCCAEIKILLIKNEQKKSRKDKQKKELISYCYLAEAEMGERTKEQKNFKNYFIHLKIWKNNLDKSRENGGLGSYQLKVYVFFPMG